MAARFPLAGGWLKRPRLGAVSWVRNNRKPFSASPASISGPQIETGVRPIAGSPPVLLSYPFTWPDIPPSQPMGADTGRHPVSSGERRRCPRLSDAKTWNGMDNRTTACGLTQKQRAKPAGSHPPVDHELLRMLHHSAGLQTLAFRGYNYFISATQSIHATLIAPDATVQPVQERSLFPISYQPNTRPPPLAATGKAPPDDRLFG